jgi:hypothetical protein
MKLDSDLLLKEGILTFEPYSLFPFDALQNDLQLHALDARRKGAPVEFKMGISFLCRDTAGDKEKEKHERVKKFLKNHKIVCGKSILLKDRHKAVH